MSSLADLPELVGFFSYARSDDENSDMALSLLRKRIRSELHMQLGRKLRLWQDTEAIPHGTLWQGQITKAIAESAFFIPIVTPSAVNSPYCRMEFEAFLGRESELWRDDLVFPILYVRVAALANDSQRSRDNVLKIIHVRQYADWTKIRLDDVASPDVGKQIAHFCEDIVQALHKPWESPEERRRREEAEARQRAEQEEARRAAEAEAARLAEEGRRREEAEAKRRAEQEEVRRAAEAEAKWRREQEEVRRAEKAEAVRLAEEGRRREEAEAKRRQEQEDVRRAAEAQAVRLAKEGRRRQDAAVRERAEREKAHGSARAEALRLADAERRRREAEKPLRRLFGVFILVIMLVGSIRSWLAPEPISQRETPALKPTASFRECDNCPEMVVLPAGSFTMGSPDSEVRHFQDESPQHVVTIGKPFAVGKFHVTFDQFTVFVVETGYDVGPNCGTFQGGKDKERSGRSWRNPGFAQEGSHPAVCLSWDDAQAYVKWLAEKTRKPYRLLTEAEWEYAARARTSPGAYPRFWFGDDEKDLCRYGNGTDQKAREAASWLVAPCNDGYVYTSPAGHFEANAFGLHDMFGNAWQWTADCYHDSYRGAPADGKAWTAGDCSSRVVRGGSWFDLPWGLRAAMRGTHPAEDRFDTLGFRLARTLTP